MHGTRPAYKITIYGIGLREVFLSLHSLSLEGDRKSPPVTQSPHSSPSHSVGTGYHNLPLGSQSSHELLISKGLHVLVSLLVSILFT